MGSHLVDSLLVRTTLDTPPVAFCLCWQIFYSLLDGLHFGQGDDKWKQGRIWKAQNKSRTWPLVVIAKGLATYAYALISDLDDTPVWSVTNELFGGRFYSSCSCAKRWEFCLSIYRNLHVQNRPQSNGDVNLRCRLIVHDDVTESTVFRTDLAVRWAYSGRIRRLLPLGSHNWPVWWQYTITTRHCKKTGLTSWFL